MVTVSIPRRTIVEAGPRPLHTARIVIKRSGRDTDQWRVISLVL